MSNISMQRHFRKRLPASISVMNRLPASIHLINQKTRIHGVSALMEDEIQGIEIREELVGVCKSLLENENLEFVQRHM